MTKLTEKGQVTIPKKIREEAGLKPGDEVKFVKKDGEIEILKKSKNEVIEKYKGLLGKDKTDRVMKELRGNE